jgi:hypothetical protein
MRKPFKVTFDGCGINDATTPYKDRVMTFTESVKRNDIAKEFGEFAERAINAHEALVATLKECETALAATGGDTKFNFQLQRVRAVLKLAGEV